MRQGLRERCLAEAMRIVAEKGIEELSLREVSRRLGISHQAPYRHFPSREHILAELVAGVFDGFATWLDETPRTGNAWNDLGALGRRYLDYAAVHPIEYRLMFATKLALADAHPAMLRSAHHAYGTLLRAIGALPPPSTGASEARILEDAMFVWSVVHGLAGILASDTALTLKLRSDEREAMIEAALKRIGAALGVDRAGPMQYRGGTP